MAINIITHEELIYKVSYNPETGLFFWNHNFGSRAAAGEVIGSDDMHGYKTVRLNKKSYKLHRLAWFYVNAEWPKGDIDHINGMRSDNRISNLRDVTRKINLENRTVSSKNACGLYGVYYDKRKKKYYSAISQNNKKIHLGMFETPEAAHAAYLQAKINSHAGFVSMASATNMVTPEMV